MASTRSSPAPPTRSPPPLAAQRALHAEPWGETGPAAGAHGAAHGVAELRDGDYFGPPLNRVARILALGHGGQMLLSRATHDLVADDLPAQTTLRALGEYQLKDLSRPEQIFQLVSPDLPSDFPAAAHRDVTSPTAVPSRCATARHQTLHPSARAHSWCRARACSNALQAGLSGQADADRRASRLRQDHTGQRLARDRWIGQRRASSPGCRWMRR